MAPDHNETRDLLIEIGCEDLPAQYVVPLAAALAHGVLKGLASRGVVSHSSKTSQGAWKVPFPEFRAVLAAHEEQYRRSGDIRAFKGLRTFATPRRLAVLLEGVELQQRDLPIEQSGPSMAVAFRDGEPTQAALGFARKFEVDVSALVEKNGKLHYSGRQLGRPTAELLPEIFEEALMEMDERVRQRMRWGDGEETFVRPVRWLTALLGRDVVPLRRFGLVAGRLTYGHRFHAPGAIALESPDEYEARLRAAKVWADCASRRTEIHQQIHNEATALGGTAKIDPALLDEVTALVEWPVVISGRIETRFLELPPEVIVATVETNQRYFTVSGEAGELMPAFITIANINPEDTTQIIAGNERVVRPRLADALFFWRQDLKQPLAAYADRLEAVTFQKDLGSTAAKVERVMALARWIAATVGADAEQTSRAAKLAKCDLVTKMVYEFPELQGLMGGYYAEKPGEPAAVATAIREHYQPVQAGGPIPSTVEGRIVAFADKLDTLAGIFAIDQKPTASKDPYALRRAALGVLRIQIEGGLALDLRALLRRALDAQPAGRRDEETLNDLWSFIITRFAGVCADRLIELQDRDAAEWLSSHPGQGFIQKLPVSEIVESIKPMGGDPVDLMKRAEAVYEFWKRPEAASLAAADKRARNLLKQAGTTGGRIDDNSFEHPAEAALAQALDQAESDLRALREVRDYGAMLQRLAALKAPVDAFFDDVMVMADDPATRANRVGLLARLDEMCREVADLSQLPDDALKLPS